MVGGGLYALVNAYAVLYRRLLLVVRRVSGAVCCDVVCCADIRPWPVRPNKEPKHPPLGSFEKSSEDPC